MKDDRSITPRPNGIAARGFALRGCVRTGLLLSLCAMLAGPAPARAGGDGSCAPIYHVPPRDGGDFGQFGWHVAALGRVDEDDAPDFAIACFLGSGPEFSAYLGVYSGATGDLVVRLEPPGEYHDALHDGLITSLVSIGDVDGDDFPEVLLGFVGSPNDSDPGRVLLFSTCDGTAVDQLNTGQAEDMFGNGAARIGDTDNDGVPDFAVGAPGYDLGPDLNAGRVYVFSGADRATLLIVNGRERGERFGRSIAGIGDWDGDGSPDLLVGAPGASTVGVNAGRADIVSGADGSILHSFHGVAAFDQLGWLVASVSGINHQGSTAIAIAAPGTASPDPYTGTVFIYSGPDAQLLATLTGQVEGDRFGYVLSSAGDVNGDGFDDIVVGSPVSQVDGQPNGRVWIHSGKDFRPLRILSGTGETPDGGFGRSVAGLGGDVDGDGLADLLIGQTAWDGDEFPYGAGFVHVFNVAPVLAADLDADGDVDAGDLGIMLATYGLLPGDPHHNALADIDGDDEIGQMDLAVLLAEYGTCCE